MFVESPQKAGNGAVMSDQELQALGANEMAYVKRFTQEEAYELALNMAEPVPDVSIHPHWGLYNADGNLVAISNDHEQLLLMAMQNEIRLAPLN